MLRGRSCVGSSTESRPRWRGHRFGLCCGCVGVRRSPLTIQTFHVRSGGRGVRNLRRLATTGQLVIPVILREAASKRLLPVPGEKMSKPVVPLIGTTSTTHAGADRVTRVRPGR
jgi:hypothetical protein